MHTCSGLRTSATRPARLENQVSSAWPNLRDGRAEHTESRVSFQGWAGGLRGMCERTFPLPEAIDIGSAQHNHAK